MNEEAFIIGIKQSGQEYLLSNPKLLMQRAKEEAPHLNFETLVRYARSYRHKNTPLEEKMENSIMIFR